MCSSDLDLSGVRAGDGAATDEPDGDAGEAADEQEEEIVVEGEAGMTDDPAATDADYIEDAVEVVADPDDDE